MDNTEWLNLCVWLMDSRSSLGQRLLSMCPFDRVSWLQRELLNWRLMDTPQGAQGPLTG